MPAADKVVYGLDLSAPGAAQTQSARIQGTLPDHWQDDSYGTQTWVKYGVGSGDRSYLRIAASKIANGKCQIYQMLPDIKADCVYEVRLEARSADGATLTLGPRDHKAPYQFHGSGQALLQKDWKEFIFDFPMTPNKQPMGLWIELGDAASVDIADVSVILPTREELEQRQALSGGAQAGNLLRITRFPLGLQSGWSLDREDSDGDDVRIKADKAQKGPSGFAALSIASENEMILRSAPFAVPGTGAHTASLYFKGDAKGSVQVMSDTKVLAEKSFEAGPAWRRLELPFHPLFLSRLTYLKINSQGRLWVDALQVEKGKRAGVYHAQKACEVSLACGGDLRLVFDDQPGIVRYCVTGKSGKGAFLKGRLFYPTVESPTDLPAVALGAGRQEQGNWDFIAAAAVPYGAFRLEAWVVDRNGKKISSDNELVFYRLHRPKSWMKDDPDSPFGTHIYSTTRAILMAKAIGCNWARLHDAGTEYLGWTYVEPKPGDWVFQDRKIQRYRKLGMEVLGVLETSPTWASRFEKPHDPYFDRYFEPKDDASFGDYVRAVAKHYDGVIGAYEVWNEPWGGFWWDSYDESKSGMAGYTRSVDPEKDFAALQKAGYQAVKSVDPGIQMVGFNTTDENNGRHWTLGVRDNGGMATCDVVSYHEYINSLPGYPGDALDAGYATAVGPLTATAAAEGKPIWLSEGSPICGGDGGGFYRITLPFENTEDVVGVSDRLARYEVGLFSLGVKKFFPYSAGVDSYFDEDADCRMFTTSEGYLDPSGAAQSALAWYLEGRHFVKRLGLVNGVEAYLFEGGGKSVAVLAPRAHHADYAVPKGPGLESADLFGNPLATPGLDRSVVYLVQAGGTERLEKALLASSDAR